MHAHRLSRRRLLATSVAGIGAVALLAACGGSTGGAATAAPTTAAKPAAATGAAPTAAPKTGSGVQVTWFAARDTTGYTQKQVDAFNALNKGVTISYQEQGATTTDLHDKFVTVASAKDPSADLVSMDVPYVPEFAAAGWTIAVDNLLSKDEQAKFFKGTIDGATYNGKLFALPWYNNGPGLFYRKDLLDGAGLKPPKTYDELLEQSKKLQTADVSGFIFQASQTEGGIIIWLEYLWGYGGAIVDDKLNIVVDKTPAGVDAMKRLISFVYTDKISPEATLTMKLSADAQNPFLEGKAVFLRLWITSAQAFESDASKVKGKWSVVPLPSQDGKAAGPGCLGTWNLGGSNFSKHQKESTDVLTYLTSQDEQTKRYLANGNIPARSAVFDDSAVKAKYTYVDLLKPAFESLKPRPVTPYYGQMSADAIQPNFGAAMTRQKQPDQAIKDMADKLRAIVKA